MDYFISLFDSYVFRVAARGNASKDTVSGYRSQLRAWLRWCVARRIQPAKAGAEDIITYRADLVRTGYKPASIAHKLAVLVQFYRAIQAEGLRPDNPAEGIPAPRPTNASDDLPVFDEATLQRLLCALPRGTAPRALRDRALVLLMALHGLRTVEAQRASVEDLQHRAEGIALLVHGKGKDRLLWLRPDVAAELASYLSARAPFARDGLGVPLFAAAGPRAGARLDRRGIRKIVDGYLKASGLKAPGISSHVLRHTAATLAYKHTRDIRAVQAMLGHASPQTTSRYARLVDSPQRNPALSVPVCAPPAL